MSKKVVSRSAMRPDDACAEGAKRINVVMSMLAAHECIEDDQAEDSSGGFDLNMMRDALQSIRTMLHEAAQTSAEVK